ncbi:MAG: hypothetical protein IJV14_15530 [Lachnospiraceae bacterium]|nr:hypothetical protein [Lachnospiraceae bacterium]
MRDKIYEILKWVVDNGNSVHKNDIAKRNSPVYVEYLFSEKLIYSELDEDGAPTDIIHVGDKGYKYIVEHDAESRRFWRNFFGQFVTGLITGGIGALILEHIILWLSAHV